MDFKNRNIVGAFWCSIEGLKILFEEKAARRELLLFPLSVLYIILFQPAVLFMVLLLVLPLLIISIEAINTAIEYICDEITMDESNKIKKAKDLGSAAIFLSLTAYGIVLLLSLFY
tara:strand:- start:140 stop:487 length:348 start_codon:yes stop_codon:yes gene_type:complete